MNYYLHYKSEAESTQLPTSIQCALYSLFHIYLSIHSFLFVSFLSFFSFTLCYLTPDARGIASHRDREHQIAEVEAGHHRAHHRLHAENKIGKNYLLEAYLNGLHEVDGGSGGGAGIGSDIDGDARDTRIDNGDEKSADTIHNNNKNKNSSNSNDNVIGIASASADAANSIDKDDEEINKVIATPANSRGNSDSGVNTTEEMTTTSPDVCLSTSPLTNGSSSSSTDNNNDALTTATSTAAMTASMAVTKTNNKNVAATKIMDTKSLKEIYKRLTSAATSTAKTKKSKKEKKQTKSKSCDVLNAREAKLIMEHESRKEFCEKIAKSGTDNPTCSDKSSSTAAAMALLETGDKTTRKVLNVDEHLAGQIELLEKVIAINKHIQREEELLVRLNAKIRKYEVDDPNLTESEMRKVLDQINTNIDASGSELLKTEHELNASHQMLMTKSQMVKQLSEELEALEIDEELCGGGKQNLIQVPSHQIQIHSSSTESEQLEQRPQQQQNAGTVHSQQQQQAPAALIHSPQETNQVPTSASASASLSIPCSGAGMKTGTLPKLISSVLKKNSQIHAKNTYCGTIPKIQQRTMCNQIMLQPPLSLPPPQSSSSAYAHPTNIERPPLPPTSIPSNAVFVAKNQSFLVPDHVILSQAPLFFQKDTFNGTFMQSTDQRNANFANGGSSSSSTITTTSSGCSSTSSGNSTSNSTTNNNNNNYSNRTISNLTSSNNINLNNVNINPSINCAAKVGPKKLINGFYKDPDSDTGLSSLGGDDALLHIGTLV